MSHALGLGLWLGISIAAPVGPIGLLVLQRALRLGARAGLACGLGAALADLLYGALAASGVRFASAYARPTALIGGVVLLVLAWRTWRQPPTVSTSSAADSSGALSNVATTFVLTVSNPMTILAFAAMIAAAGTTAPAWFVSGVFAGSMLWWTLLSSAASLLGARLRERQHWIARASALTLVWFALRALWRARAV